MAQLLSNLPVGAKVKFGKHQVGGETPWGIAWLIVAKSHPGYPANSITLLTDQIIDTRAYDAREPNNANESRRNEGNNRYSVSNIDQWLNSRSASWYTATHSADTPPRADYLLNEQGSYAYDTRNGFLFNFTSEEYSAILDTTIRSIIPSVDGGGYEDISRKAFLPSNTELRSYAVNEIFEGTQFEWFAKNPVFTCTVAPLARANGAASPPSPSDSWRWRTRTGFGYYGFNAGSATVYVADDGSYNSTGAYISAVGIRPVVNLASTVFFVK